MSRDNKTVRRRDGGRPEATASAQASPLPLPAPRLPAALASQAPAKETHRKLDVSDLELIASMNPADIAAMMDTSAASKPRIMVGAKVTGPITRLTRENIFIDIGGKSEGELDIAEIPDAKLGDMVTAFVLETDEWGIHLSKRLSGAAAADFIDAAAQTGLPVEGKVASRNPGGYDVRIGSMRAFCPTSQMDRHPDADPDKYIGQTFDFKVLEVRDGDVVLSRRALLDANMDEARKSFWMNAKIGDVKQGVVSSVAAFGVFVEIDGVDGLVPKRELSWDDAGDAAATYKRGMTLPVRIIDLDHENKKITLSARDPSLSPWTRVGVDFVQGGTYSGTVARTAPFGAFVELAPGLVGLLHSSRGGKRNVGDVVSVRITGLDIERQRLELAATDHVEPQATDGVGAIVKGKVAQVLKNGLAIDLDDGQSGWVPSREIDLPQGTLLAQRFRAGKEIQARVTEQDPARRRLVLSLKLEADEGENWRSKPQTGGSGGQSLGTFAGLLSGVKAKK